MKNNFNLEILLEEVAHGKVSVNKAKSKIEKYYTLLKASKSELKKEKPKLSKAFDAIKKSMHLEDVLKMSTQFVQQISENVPQKLQENFGPQIGFSSKIQGIDSKLSVFRAVEVPPGSEVEDNQVVGSQWFGVSFYDNCHVKQNKFTAIQMTELILRQSDFCRCQLSLSRMSHVTMQEACFSDNKISLSTWSDVSITESDFTLNKLGRCDFSGMVVNGSRFSRLSFSNVNFKDCEFDSCDIQGIEFENCEFKDCSFSQIQAVSEKAIKVSGRRFVGKQFSQCQSVEEFLELLNAPSL